MYLFNMLYTVPNCSLVYCVAASPIVTRKCLFRLKADPFRRLHTTNALAAGNCGRELSLI